MNEDLKRLFLQYDNQEKIWQKIRQFVLETRPSPEEIDNSLRLVSQDVREIMEKRGLKREEMAPYVGKSEKTVQRWLKPGKRPLDIQDSCLLLKISLDQRQELHKLARQSDSSTAAPVSRQPVHDQRREGAELSVSKVSEHEPISDNGERPDANNYKEISGMLSLIELRTIEEHEEKVKRILTHYGSGNPKTGFNFVGIISSASKLVYSDQNQDDFKQ